MLDLQVFKYPVFTFTLVINAIVTMALFGDMLLLRISAKFVALRQLNLVYYFFQDH